VDINPQDTKPPLYRSRGFSIAPVLIYLLVEGSLAAAIRNNGCGLPITISELVPAILTLGGGAVGSVVLLRIGATPGRRVAQALGASLGLGVVAGLVIFLVALWVLNCV